MYYNAFRSLIYIYIFYIAKLDSSFLQLTMKMFVAEHFQTDWFHASKKDKQNARGMYTSSSCRNMKPTSEHNAQTLHSIFF